MSDHVKITAILTAHAGKEAELFSILERMAPRCRAETGNLRWDVWRDQAQSGRFTLDELYVDDAAVEAHRSSDHYRDYAARVPSLADRIAVVCDPALLGEG